MADNSLSPNGTSLVVLFVLLTAGVLGFVLWEADTSAASRRIHEDNPAVALKIGSPLPQFKLLTQDRVYFNMRSMCQSRRAKALMIHFFSLEKQDYDREFSKTADLERRYGDKGLYSIYINTDMSPRKEMLAFTKARSLASPLLLDMYAKTLSSYGFEQSPATVLADRNCRVLQVYTHKMPLNQRAEQVIQWSLDMGPSPFAKPKPAPLPPPASKPVPPAAKPAPRRRFPAIHLSVPSVLKKQPKAPARPAKSK